MYVRYMCRSEPQIADRAVSWLTSSLQAAWTRTSSSNFNDCIVGVLNLWQGHFSNADLEGLFIVNRLHGGRGRGRRHVEFWKG